MFSLIGSNIIFNIIEYFSFINLLLLFLFIIIILFFILINSTLLYYNNINFNHCLIEFISTLFSLLFIIIIISPALIILFDFDLIILPSFIIYSLGLQWAWQFNIIFLPINIGFNSNYDHYIINSSYSERMNECSNWIFNNYTITALINSEQINERVNIMNEWMNKYWIINKELIKRMNERMNIMNEWIKWVNIEFNSNYDHYIINSSYSERMNVMNEWIIIEKWMNEWINNKLINERMKWVNEWVNVAKINYSLIRSPLNTNKTNELIIKYPLYLIDMNCYLLLPLYSFIRIFIYSFDVIHTLGFYSWGIKIDAIPGRINITTTLRLLNKGEYRGKCFELCGQGHFAMSTNSICF